MGASSLTKPSFSGLSGVALTRNILTSWKNVNFSSISSTIRYHVSKHGNGVSIGQYTDDALNFFKTNQGLGKAVILKDGTKAVKIKTSGGGQGGIFTPDGKNSKFLV